MPCISKQLTHATAVLVTHAVDALFASSDSSIQASQVVRYGRGSKTGDGQGWQDDASQEEEGESRWHTCSSEGKQAPALPLTSPWFADSICKLNFSTHSA